MELQRKRNIDLCEKIEKLESRNFSVVMNSEASLSELRQQLELEQQRKFMAEAELEEMKSNLVGSLQKFVQLCHKSLSIQNNDN